MNIPNLASWNQSRAAWLAALGRYDDAAGALPLGASAAAAAAAKRHAATRQAIRAPLIGPAPCGSRSARRCTASAPTSGRALQTAETAGIATSAPPIAP